jgi:2-polyprenyl-3-methyl-5-hydroxy-6-metoxy-1,4-benzoquinol methylase
MEQNTSLSRLYFDSSFGQVNVLTRQQYEKAASHFECLYKDILPEDRGAAILDVGCGCGHFLYYLTKQNYNAFLGIDISPQQIDHCKTAITDRVQVHDVFEFLKSNDDTYDVITAHDLVEHIPKERTLELLALVHQALKRGGTFIVRVPNMSNPLSLDSRYSDFSHEAGFTVKSLRQVLSVGGFRNVRILAPQQIEVHSFRNRGRKMLVKALHALIRLSYYIQDFTVPEHLDKNITAVCNATRPDSSGVRSETCS